MHDRIQGCCFVFECVQLQVEGSVQDALTALYVCGFILAFSGSNVCADLACCYISFQTDVCNNLTYLFTNMQWASYGFV